MGETGSNETETIVAIVPAKDSADRIGATVRALIELESIDRVLVVDDGSDDDTGALARQAGADVLRLERNRGKGGAVAAGVAVTGEATIYVLIDADLSETAAHAGVLVEPVVRGEADLVVGVLPSAGGRGGFGLVRSLSARGIRSACGLTMRAPLSGQRAVRAEYLRDGLAASDRFGLEVAMTIDVARGGGRVHEVDVPMDHRHTGRSVSGFVHRGRQGIDIIASLWPRMFSERRRIGALALLTLLVTAGALVMGTRNSPVTQPLGRKASKVVIFGMEPFGFDDLNRGVTPNLARLIDQGAIGAMSVRAVSRYPSSTEGYLAISAGARLDATSAGGKVFDADQSIGSMTASQYVAGLTGARPRGAFVAVAGPSMQRRNDNASADGKPGTLAQLLERSHHASAVVANSDRPEILSTSPTTDRAAALAVMDRSFGIAHGTIDSAKLLEADPSAPYGVRADAAAFAKRTKAALKTSDFVVVDPGDLTRAQSFGSRASDEAAKRIWTDALRRSDAILGRVADELGPNTLLLVVSVRAPHSAFRLTPVVASGAGVPRGIITSPSTQRPGLSAITDLAPTVMSALGVAVPDDLPGNALRYEPGSHRLGLLHTYDADTQVRERTYVPTCWVYIWFQAVIAVALLFVVSRRSRFEWAGPGLRFALLAVASLPAASFLVRLIPGLTAWFIAAQGIVTGILCLAIGWFVASRRRHALSPLAWLCAITVVIIVVDIWTGSHLEASSWLGYSFHSAGRFYGVPNTTFAVLGACTLIWSGIMMQYTQARRMTLWVSGCVMFVVLVSAGAPMLGADVGTLITLGPIFALYLWVLSGRRIRVKGVLLAAFGMVALVVAAAALDLTRAPADRSHLGRFASDLLTNGPSVLTDTFLRKQSANFTILQGSLWTRLIPFVAIFWFVPLVWDRRAQEIFGRRRSLVMASWFVVAGAVLGFASNDSGPLVIALFVAWLLPLLALLLLDAQRAPDTLVTADGSIIDHPDVAVGLDPFDEPAEDGDVDVMEPSGASLP